MQRTIGRMAVLLAVLALLFAACGPAQRARQRLGHGRRLGPLPASRPAHPSRPPPPPPRSPSNDSQANPGDVMIRWYCCLGTGDAPEQVQVELKVADDFNASHAGIHLQFEGSSTPAPRCPVDQLGSGNGPDVVGPVGVGGAEGSRASGSTCSHSSTRLAST